MNCIIITRVKSTCCNAPLQGGLMSPIDTGLTLFCTACKKREKEAEKIYDQTLEDKKKATFF